MRMDRLDRRRFRPLERVLGIFDDKERPALVGEPLAHEPADPAVSDQNGVVLEAGPHQRRLVRGLG